MKEATAYRARYAQGLAVWSHGGDRITYVVSAINGVGKSDIYIMNSDRTSQKNVTPSYYPNDFLCYSPVFSANDQILYFVGYWIND